MIPSLSGFQGTVFSYILVVGLCGISVMYFYEQSTSSMFFHVERST
jgi:hypothetical protein